MPFFELRSVLDLKLNRNLNGNPERTPAFPLDQRCSGPQTGFGLFLTNRLVEDEVRARAEHVAHFCLVAEQGNGHRFDARRGLAGVLQYQRCTMRIVEVNNDGVKLLFGEAAQRFRIPTAGNSNTTAGEQRESALPLLLHPWKPKVQERLTVPLVSIE